MERRINEDGHPTHKRSLITGLAATKTKRNGDLSSDRLRRRHDFDMDKQSKNKLAVTLSRCKSVGCPEKGFRVAVADLGR